MSKIILSNTIHKCMHICVLYKWIYVHLILKQLYKVETITPHFIDKIINSYKVLVSYSKYPSSLWRKQNLNLGKIIIRSWKTKNFFCWYIKIYHSFKIFTYSEILPNELPITFYIKYTALLCFSTFPSFYWFHYIYIFKYWVSPLPMNFCWPNPTPFSEAITFPWTHNTCCSVLY